MFVTNNLKVKCSWYCISCQWSFFNQFYYFVNCGNFCRRS